MLYEAGHAFSFSSAKFYTDGGANQTPGAALGKQDAESCAHMNDHVCRIGERASVLANLRRADGFGGGLVGCQLLSLEQHRSGVLPQVSAGSVERSCWRASVRFSVSLRVGSSGLLGDLAGDPGLHPADERDKVRLATKTLGAAWWRAASRITALSHIGRSACGLAIVFVLVPVTSAAGRVDG